MRKLKYGIVGWGTISGIHAQALTNACNCLLSAVYTSSEIKAKEIKTKYNVDVFTNYNDMLKSDIDVVSICTPSGTHLEYGVQAAVNGKHVVVEKPIEITTERGRELINACKNNNVLLGVIFQNRYLDAVKKIKKFIDENGLGKIHHVSAYVKWWRGQDYYDSSQWRGTYKLDGGGALMNQSIHTVDLLIYLIGNIKEVAAFTGTFAHERIEVEDSAVIAVKFESGAIGVMEVSTSIQPAQPRRIEIHGEKGTVILNGDEAVFNIPGFESSIESVISNSGADSPLAGFKFEPHMLQLEEISEAILNKNEIRVDGEEALKSLAVVKAVYKASKLNRIELIPKN